MAGAAETGAPDRAQGDDPRAPWPRTEPSAAPPAAAAPPPGPAVAGDGGLSPAEDAHGVVRPVRWAPVLIGAGAAAAGALLRGLRRRR